jgi:HEAT repeat protein
VTIGTPEAFDPLRRLLLQQFARQRETIRKKRNRRRVALGFAAVYLALALLDLATDWPSALIGVRLFTHLFMMLSIFGFGASEALNERQRFAAQAAAGLDDLRLAAPLALMLVEDDKGVREAAAEALKRILPNVKASDAECLPEDAQRALAAGLKRGDDELFYAILSALEQVGGEAVIPAVEKVVRTEVYPDSYSRRKREAAESCLLALRQRAAESRQSTTLLRPSAAGFTDSANLVRPAESAANAAESLLRPTGQAG